MNLVWERCEPRGRPVNLVGEGVLLFTLFVWLCPSILTTGLHILFIRIKLTFGVRILIVNRLHCATEEELHILLHQTSVKGAQVHVLVKDCEVCDLMLRQLCDVTSISILIAKKKRQAGVRQCDELLVLQYPPQANSIHGQLIGK